MNTRDNYISNTRLRDKPKKPLSLVLKKGSVTTDKIADKSISLDKLEENVKERIVNKTLDAYVKDEQLILKK